MFTNTLNDRDKPKADYKVCSLWSVYKSKKLEVKKEEGVCLKGRIFESL